MVVENPPMTWKLLNPSSQSDSDVDIKSHNNPCFSFRSIYRIMTPRIINYNKRLYGPGPVARIPAPGIRGYYARMPPLQGFTMAAVHGITLGFGLSFYYKYFMGDPDTLAIKKYYEENPPR
jgi:hypothetical protein